MAKKERIAIQRDATLEMVDTELESAMTQLDGMNQKVEELLASMAPPPEASVSADESGDAGSQSGGEVTEVAERTEQHPNS